MSHIQGQLQDLGRENAGEGAYAASAAFHSVLFTIYPNWRGTRRARVRAPDEVRRRVVEKADELRRAAELARQGASTCGELRRLCQHLCEELHLYMGSQAKTAVEYLLTDEASREGPLVVFNHHAYTEMGKTLKGRRMALAMAVAAIKADPRAREGVDTAPLPVHPMPAQTDLAEVPIQLAAHEVRTWLDEVATEADLIADMVTKHAERLAGFYAARAKPTATRDEEYREAFRPFHDVAELRREIERHSLGKTGRLMTMDELAALSDSQLEPFLHMTHLIFAGETPSVLKLGDVV